MPQRRANPYGDDRPRPGQTAQYHPGGASLAESGRRTGQLAGDPSVTQPSQRPEQARPAPPPSPFGGGPGEPTPSPMAEDLTIAPGFPIPDFPSPGDRPEAPLPRPPSPEGPASRDISTRSSPRWTRTTRTPTVPRTNASRTRRGSRTTTSVPRTSTRAGRGSRTDAPTRGWGTY